MAVTSPRGCFPERMDQTDSFARLLVTFLASAGLQYGTVCHHGRPISVIARIRGVLVTAAEKLCVCLEPSQHSPHHWKCHKSYEECVFINCNLQSPAHDLATSCLTRHLFGVDDVTFLYLLPYYWHDSITSTTFLRLPH